MIDKQYRRKIRDKRIQRHRSVASGRIVNGKEGKMWGGGKLKEVAHSNNNKEAVSFRRKSIKKLFFPFSKLGNKKFKYCIVLMESLVRKSYYSRHLLCYPERYEFYRLLRQRSCFHVCLIGCQLLQYFFGILRHLLHLLLQLLLLLCLCNELYRPHLSPFFQYFSLRNTFRHLLRYFLYYFSCYFLWENKQYLFLRLLHHSLLLILYHLYVILCFLNYLCPLLQLFSWYYCWIYLTQWLVFSEWYSISSVFRRLLRHILCDLLRHLRELVRYLYCYLMRLLLRHLFICRCVYFPRHYLYQFERRLLRPLWYTLCYFLRYLLSEITQFVSSFLCTQNMRLYWLGYNHSILLLYCLCLFLSALVFHLSSYYFQKDKQYSVTRYLYYFLKLRGYHLHLVLLRYCLCHSGCFIGYQLLQHLYGFLRHHLHLFLQLPPCLLLCHGLHCFYTSSFYRHLIMQVILCHLLQYLLLNFCNNGNQKNDQNSLRRLLLRSLRLIIHHVYFQLCLLSHLCFLLRLFSCYYFRFYNYMKLCFFLSYWYFLTVFRRRYCQFLYQQLYYFNVAGNHYRHLLKLVRYRYRLLMYCRNTQRQSTWLMYYILYCLLLCRYDYLLSCHLHQFKRYVFCLLRYLLWYFLRYSTWSFGCDDMTQESDLLTWCELNCSVLCVMCINYWWYQLVKFLQLSQYREVNRVLWCYYYLIRKVNCRPSCQPVCYRLCYTYNIWLRVCLVPKYYWNCLQNNRVELLSWFQVCLRLCCVWYVLYKWYTSLTCNIVRLLVYQLYWICRLLGLLSYHYRRHQRILGLHSCGYMSKQLTCGAYYYCRCYLLLFVTTKTIFNLMCTQTKYQSLLLYFLCHYLSKFLRYNLCNSAVCSLCKYTWLMCSVNSYCLNFSLCTLFEQSSCGYLHHRSCGIRWSLNQRNKRNGDGAWSNVWIVELMGFFQNGKGERVDCNRKLQDHVSKKYMARKNRNEEVVKEEYLLEVKMRELTERNRVARMARVVGKVKKEKLYKRSKSKLARKNERKRKMIIRYIRGSTPGIIIRYRKHGENTLRQDCDEIEGSRRRARQIISILIRRESLIQILLNKKDKRSGNIMNQMWYSIEEKWNSVKEGGQTKSEKVKIIFGIKINKKSRKYKLYKEVKNQRNVSTTINNILAYVKHVRNLRFKEEGTGGVTLYGIREQTHTEYRNEKEQISGNNSKDKADDLYIGIIRKKIFTSTVGWKYARVQQYEEDGKFEATIDGIRKQLYMVHRNKIWWKMREDERERKRVKLYRTYKRNINEEKDVVIEMWNKDKYDKRDDKLRTCSKDLNTNLKVRSKEKGMHSLNAIVIQKAYLRQRDKAEERKIRQICEILSYCNGHTGGYTLRMSGGYWMQIVEFRIDEVNRCRKRRSELRVQCQMVQGNNKGLRLCCDFMNINLRKREGKTNPTQGENRKGRVQTRRKGGFEVRLIQGMKMNTRIPYGSKKVGGNWKRKMGIRKYD